MKNRGLQIVHFLIVSLIFGCKNYPDEVKHYYKDGTLKAHIITYNSKGKRDAFNYHPNGKINFIYKWENYRNDGITEWYDSLGRLLNRQNFIDNKANGLSTYYYPSGNLQAVSEMKDNTKQGWAKVYFDKEDTIRKRLVFFQKDSVVYDILYNEDGQVIESYLPHKIEMISETEDTVLLRFELLFSRYPKLAVKFGDLENISEEYSMAFDNDIRVETKLAKSKERKVEGLLLEVAEFKEVEEESEDSTMIFKYEAQYPFTFQY